MRNTDTVKKSKGENRFRIFYFFLEFFPFAFCLLPLSAGCQKQTALSSAQYYEKHSKTYYQKSVDAYRNLIEQGKDVERARLELGNYPSATENSRKQ